MKTIIITLLTAMTTGLAALSAGYPSSLEPTTYREQSNLFELPRCEGGRQSQDGRVVTDEGIANDTIKAELQNSELTDVKPQFPGGDKELKKFLSKNVRYPDLASQYSVEGKVIMHFTVDTDGSVKDISATDCKIERFNTTKFSQETEARQAQLKEQFALLFAKEGARVIRKMPKWTPGKLNGQTTSVRYNLSIHFVDPSK